MAVWDKYSSFSALRRAESADAFQIECIDRGTDLAVIAPHGGGIEPGTSPIARAIAGDDCSLYLFEGKKRSGNGVLHITSANFDEPTGRTLVEKSERVIAVHGCEGKGHAVYLGGLDRALRDAIGTALEAGGFKTGTHSNPNLQGLAVANICNRGRSGRGVQLEISCGLRDDLVKNGIVEFAAAVRKGAGLS
jgi:phage replication-related protein YjqB (UPF0714/DUF867 family)